MGLENSSWNFGRGGAKSRRQLGLAATEQSFGECVWKAICLFLFCLICWGAFKKRHLGVSLFFSLSLRHVLNMHAPTHNGLKCKWQFYTLCFFCLFLMFCFARCIRWRFGLLAPNMRATVYVFERVRSPGVLAVCFCYAFAIYFGLMFTFGSFYVLCVFYSHAILCSRGLNLSFLHRLFLSFFLSVEYKFALLTLSFKNFYIQSHCLPTFFLLFLLIGFNIISFFRLDSSRIWFFFHFFFLG